MQHFPSNLAQFRPEEANNRGPPTETFDKGYSYRILQPFPAAGIIDIQIIKRLLDTCIRGSEPVCSGDLNDNVT